MQKKPQKTLHLTQLISQPECLKLLILHTPFLLDLGSLPLCVNLVKLDLSKNNLQVFPYLGDLPNLKFMFLHQNKLDVDGLVGIFQKGALGNGEDDGDEGEGQDDYERGMISRGRSVLSRSIIWVTYWGNKGQFSARHYLINRTSVIAVDHWMVVPEEKSQAVMAGIKEVQRHRGKTVQPFSDITDIRQILQNRRKFNKNASQQEYMEQFWQDIAQIRKKYVQINPIIKIQKVFRGWSYRIKKIRKQLEISQKKSSLSQSFKSWLFFTKNSKKLRLILQKRKKAYLLLPPSQMKIEHLKQKIRLFAQQCKNKVLLRKMNLRCQYKFFNALKSNQQSLHSLYNILHINIQDSKYLMIHIEGIEQWRSKVLPVVRGMNESKGVEIVEEANRDVQLRYLYESGRKRREFLRLMEINQKSLVYVGRIEGGDENGKTGRIVKEGSQSQRSKYGINALIKYPPKLSKIYSLNNVHFSHKQDQTMKKIQKSFNTKLTLNLSQLRKVSVRSSSPQLSTQVLRDLVRMSYFFNMGYLTNCQPPPQKINFLSQYSIKRMTAILRIQKMWRGRALRRKLKQIINKNFIRQRAAIRIQRWVRNLGWRHRQVWMIQQIREMRAIEGESFYVDMEEYMGIVGQSWGKGNGDGEKGQKRMMFLEQNIRPHINQKNKRLLLSWDVQSHNQSAFINYRSGKKLFTNHFNQLVFGSPPNLQPIITYPQQPHYQKCQISHLFHYQTQISILTLPFSLPVFNSNSNSNLNSNPKNKKYTKLLQVKCHNKYQCRLRILALRLHTYKFNKKFQGLKIYTKETLGLSSIGREMKKVIKNNNSIFLGQESSMFQIQPVQSSIAKIFNYQSKFYITLQNNQKPIKFTSNLKIILISSQLEQSKHYNLIPTPQPQAQNQAQLNPNPYANKNDKKLRSMSYNQHFDISNFLISDTSDIKLQTNKNQKQSINAFNANTNANEPISDIKPYMGKKYIKESLKNIQYYKKQKYRNRQRVHTEFYEQLPNNMVVPATNGFHGNGNRNKFNFMLGDPSPLPCANPNPNKARNDRLTTQPDLTHERSLGSMGSIFGENQNQNNANIQGNLRNVGSSNSRLQSIVRPHSLHQSQKKQIQSRILARKSVITNQQSKATSKNLDTFTKNFINQGNFIQNQFLYGQIKRLKTEAQQNSYSQANRIKTEQNQTQKNLQSFQEEKIKRAQNMHQRHKEELFRSMIEKRLEIQAREKQKNKEKQREREKDKKRKIDGKQGYRSLPRKMRINFAEECYPILGKYGPQEPKLQEKKGN